MNKIPTIFERDWDGDKSRVTRTPHPDCAWVFNGEGIATVKIDGTCCLIREGKLFKRYDAKPGRTPPKGFEPCGEADPVTGHHVGWVPVGDGPEDRYHLEALDGGPYADGTYELVGPKIQGNPEKFTVHFLVKHGAVTPKSEVPRDYDGLAKWLETQDIEGIVFHHPDGRMAKIKKRDFGFRR